MYNALLIKMLCTQRIIFFSLFLLICITTNQLRAFNDAINTNTKVKMKVVLDTYPIRIALAVDDNSLKDIIILMSSVIESTIVHVLDTSESILFFHIVAVGKDLESAQALKSKIEGTIKSCLPFVQREVVAFFLPPTSGLAAQLSNLKLKSSHWNSQCGADMVRFYLPEIFPTVPRLLYLDNDVIVSCCIEEIWGSQFEPHVAVGVVLDDLKWATATQWQRHYNASHPLVVRHLLRGIHRGSNESVAFITEDQFVKALPRYPNDGVLLLDVAKYSQYQVLRDINQLAAANGRGEYAVNVGTQQFTVLTLFDRWTEISPRANLRHFPDMARGYLLWFMYHGVLHYAGQAKPRALCLHSVSSDNENRVQSYTAWALANRQVSERCPSDTHAYVPECVSHLHAAASIADLLLALWRISSTADDELLLFVHFGPLANNLNRSAFLDHSAGLEFSVQSHIDSNASSNAVSAYVGQQVDLVRLLSLAVLHNTSWSLRTYENAYSNAYSNAEGNTWMSRSNRTLSEAVASIQKKSANRAAIHSALQERRRAKKHKLMLAHNHASAANRRLASNKKKAKPKPHPIYGMRSFKVTDGQELCSEIHPLRPASNAGMLSNNKQVLYSTNPNPQNRTLYPTCINLLPHLQATEEKQHWDVVGVVIDMHSPQSPSQTPSYTRNTAYWGLSHSSQSLGLLHNLDLTFLRPKLVFVRLYSPTDLQLLDEISLAEKLLRRQGYVVAHDRDACVLHKDKKKLQERLLYACVWGIRLNTFETRHIH